MLGKRIHVQLNVPADPRRITQLLEEQGFIVEELIEVRGGGILNTVDLVSFVVEHLDAVVTGVLAGVITNWISKTPGFTFPERGVNFSVKERTGGDTFIIKVKGDGNFIQMHPRPETSEEE